MIHKGDVLFSSDATELGRENHSIVFDDFRTIFFSIFLYLFGGQVIGSGDDLVLVNLEHIDS